LKKIRKKQHSPRTYPTITDAQQMAQVLEIAQNASIRWMRVDDIDLFSVLDCIKYVCPHNSLYTQTVW
jgi:hypothetical protein